MSRLLITGTPNSGKSTFIAALRHLLVAKEVLTDLELIGLADDEAHLNRLEEEWLACESVQRTKTSTEGWVTLKIRIRTTGETAELSIPDLRGEAFEQPACISQCRTELLAALSNSDGLLLFTNADRQDDMMLIDDISDMFDGIDPGGEEPTAALSDEAKVEGQANGSEQQDTGEHQGFDPSDMPEEVKVVEFLQVANRRPLQEKKRKIGVLVSAWDVVPVAESDEPEKWFRSNRPMLAQFLDANSNLWELRVYGVSAQGGKLPEQKEKLERISCQSKRIQIVGDDVAEHDLSAPLHWLMS